MLQSVLPGLREIRAPLVSGYLWLAALWLAFGQHVIDAVPADPDDATNEVAELVSLALDAFGPVGQGVMLSVAAYLLGSALLLGEAALIKLYVKRSWVPDGGSDLAHGTEATLRERFPASFERAERIGAEADFRFGVLVPGLLMVGVLSLRLSCGWLLVLPVLGLVASDYFRLRRQELRLKSRLAAESSAQRTIEALRAAIDAMGNAPMVPEDERRRQMLRDALAHVERNPERLESADVQLGVAELLAGQEPSANIW